MASEDERYAAIYALESNARYETEYDWYGEGSSRFLDGWSTLTALEQDGWTLVRA